MPPISLRQLKRLIPDLLVSAAPGFLIAVVVVGVFFVVVVNIGLPGIHSCDRIGDALQPVENVIPIERQIVVCVALIFLQAVARVGKLADEQEKAVEDFLASKGWVKTPSVNVKSPSDVPPKMYMRKTRCQSSMTATKEVDIACGVKSNLIMAMECKVSNDATNSVKRIHDVTDKTKSWSVQWGNMIQTAAMLQGVIAYKDVKQLLDQNVLVFWSHDLEPLGDWLENNV